MLLEFIENKKFTYAFRLRGELEEAGISLPQDVRYMPIVTHVASSHMRNERTAATFNSWASLIPTPPEVASLPFFQSAAFTKSEESVALTMRYAITLAYLGYSSSIASAIVPHIVRRAPIKASTAFMEVFAAADLAYRRNARLASAERTNSSDFKRWYGLAVRTHCLCHRTKHACALLREAQSRGYAPALFTLQFLAAHLRKSGDLENGLWVGQEIRQAQKRSSIAPSTPPLHALYDRMQQAFARGHVPSQHAIQQFVDQALSVGSFKSMGKLLDWVGESSSFSKAINAVASAEMSYYLRQGRELEALYIFHTHFHPVATPKAIRTYLKQADFSNIPSHLTVRPTRLDRVYPEAKVTVLLWDLVVRAVRPEQLHILYREFITSLLVCRKWRAGGMDALLPREKRYLLEILRGPPPQSRFPNPYSMDHFRLFLRAHARFNHTLSVALIVKRMLRLGWHPKDGDLTVITGTFARGGSARRLASLLERLRKAAVARGGASEGDRGVGTTRMYRPAISSMMATNRLRDAAYLARFLRRRVQYKMKTSKKTDRVIHILSAKLASVSLNIRSRSAIS